MKEDQISKLLRLKRYEHPAKGYHEMFLHEFRRRQRAALMQSSLFERIQQFLDERLFLFTPKFYAYASVLVVALAASSMILLEDPSSPALVESTSPATYSLSSPPPVTIPSSLPVISRDPAPSMTLPAHYVLEPRPVSYDAPFSF